MKAKRTAWPLEKQAKVAGVGGEEGRFGRFWLVGKCSWLVNGCFVDVLTLGKNEKQVDVTGICFFARGRNTQKQCWI